MTTITVDLLDENSITLLHEMELLNLISIRRRREEPKTTCVNLVAKYKGAMSCQPISDIDQQVKDLRYE